MGRPATTEELTGARVGGAEDSSYDTDRDYDPMSTRLRLKRAATRAGRELAKRAKTEGPVDAALGSVGTAIGETALTGATGFPLTVAGGVVGGARALGGMALGGVGKLLTGREGVGETPDEALAAGARVSHAVQGAAFAPRSEAGKLTAELMATPFELASEYGGKVVAAVGKAFGPKGEAAGRTIGEAAPVPALTALGLRKPSAVRPGAVPPAAVGGARALATSIGRDYDSLPAALQQRLADLVQESTAAGTELDPAAIQRKLGMEELPVPIERATKGQYTRDPGQLKLESTLQFSKEGAPIRGVLMDQDATLAANLDYLKGKTGGAELDERGVGRSLAGSMEKARRRSLDRVDELYDKFRASKEISDPVSPKGIVDWVTANGAKALSVPAIKSLAEALKKLGAVGTSRAGRAKAGRDLTLGEMEEVRRLAVDLREQEGPTRHAMGEAISVIDRSIERAGGELAKAARAARKEHAIAFEDPDSVYQLTAMKSRTDRQVALEDVWRKTVVGNDVDGLTQVRDRLLKDPDRAARKEGAAAWRDLQAYTIEHLTQAATGGLAKNERGARQFSVGNYSKALKSIGRGNLEVLFEKKVVDQLYRIEGVAADLKTNPASAGGSDTMPRLLRMLERVGSVFDVVPVVGKYAADVVGGAVRGVNKLREMGKAGRLVDEALSYTPTPRYDLGAALGTKRKATAAGFASVPPIAETAAEERPTP
jgi:hypothetical protein